MSLRVGKLTHGDLGLKPLALGGTALHLDIEVPLLVLLLYLQMKPNKYVSNLVNIKPEDRKLYHDTEASLVSKMNFPPGHLKLLCTLFLPTIMYQGISLYCQFKIKVCVMDVVNK